MREVDYLSISLSAFIIEELAPNKVCYSKIFYSPPVSLHWTKIIHIVTYAMAYNIINNISHDTLS